MALWRPLFFIVVMIFTAGPAACGGKPALSVAVAANFLIPLEQIAGQYQRRTGVEPRISTASTGSLYAQIVNRAPFDLFLAADARRPGMLFRNDLCEEPFTYAKGRVALWRRDKKIAAPGWRQALRTAGIHRIGIASPDIAPYGGAAYLALEKSGFLPEVKGRLVYGRNVSQAFHYGQKGLVDLTFTAMSFVLTGPGRKGVYWPVEDAGEVVQQGCVVSASPRRNEARRFMEFLLSAEAGKTLREYGYR